MEKIETDTFDVIKKTKLKIENMRLRDEFMNFTDKDHNFIKTLLDKYDNVLTEYLENLTLEQKIDMILKLILKFFEHGRLVSKLVDIKVDTWDKIKKA